MFLLCNSMLAKIQPVLFTYLPRRHHAKRSIFAEFIDLPHSCIFTQSHNKKFSVPTVLSVKNFRNSVSRICAENKQEGFLKFPLDWLHGCEFDQFQGSRDDSWWWYSIADGDTVSYNRIKF